MAHAFTSIRIVLIYRMWQAFGRYKNCTMRYYLLLFDFSFLYSIWSKSTATTNLAIKDKTNQTDGMQKPVYTSWWKTVPSLQYKNILSPSRFAAISGDFVKQSL